MRCSHQLESHDGGVAILLNTNVLGGVDGSCFFGFIRFRFIGHCRSAGPAHDIGLANRSPLELV
jgi:hypothetical protein